MDRVGLVSCCILFSRVEHKGCGRECTKDERSESEGTFERSEKGEMRRVRARHGKTRDR